MDLFRRKRRSVAPEELAAPDRPLAEGSGPLRCPPELAFEEAPTNPYLPRHAPTRLATEEEVSDRAETLTDGEESAITEPNAKVIVDTELLYREPQTVFGDPELAIVTTPFWRPGRDDPERS